MRCAASPSPTSKRACSRIPTMSGSPCRVRRSSPSWATSTTARPRCSTRSVTPTWWPAKPAASPSTSAPIRSTAPGGEKITFIDTPGHAAFTAMRARGAKVTDIVVLVVAADDGVMPQTIEAIRHAKAANAPIIVAINKIDKPEANPQRVMQELLQHDVQVEAFGGETLAVEVSATKQTQSRQAAGSHRAAGRTARPRGRPRPQRGRHGHRGAARSRPRSGRDRARPARHAEGRPIVVAGSQWGRVRALINDHGETSTEALPSMPVEVLGFDGAPEAGDRVAVVENEARAREITEYRERQKREKLAARGVGVARTSLHDMMSNLKRRRASRNCRSSSRATCRARWKRSSPRSKSSATRKCGARHSWRRRRRHRIRRHAGEASKAVIIGFNVRAHKEARDHGRTARRRNPLLQHHLQPRG